MRVALCLLGISLCGSCSSGEKSQDAGAPGNPAVQDGSSGGDSSTKGSGGEQATGGSGGHGGGGASATGGTGGGTGTGGSSGGGGGSNVDQSCQGVGRAGGADAQRCADAFPAQWSLCKLASDCTFFPKDCCPPCPLQSSDVVAVDRDHQREAMDFHCCDAKGEMCTQPGECPRCPTAPAYRTMWNVCKAERCSVLDIAHDDVSACTTDDDCVIRAPGCCPCDAGKMPLLAQLTVINKNRESDYQALVCDSNPPSCDACTLTLPENAKATCAADKHCVVSP